MTRATTVWEIPKGTRDLKKLSDGEIDFEKTLEEWIEQHPELVEPGLKVLARQFKTEGGPLDLLCVDSDGGLVVVELKRADAYREALAQALDYAACVDALTYDQLRDAVNENRVSRNTGRTWDDIVAPEWETDLIEPRIILIGTGADKSLIRIVDYLTTQYAMPINGVFFDVSISSSGSTILVRSAVVEDQVARRRGRGGSHEELLELARRHGVDTFVEPVLAAWLAATTRQGRPERGKQCWSLATKSNGTKVAAWIYPYDEDPLTLGAKTAWLELAAVPKLLTELSLDETQLKQSFVDAGINVVDENYIGLSSDEDVRNVISWIQRSFPAK